MSDRIPDELFMSDKGVLGQVWVGDDALAEFGEQAPQIYIPFNGVGVAELVLAEDKAVFALVLRLGGATYPVGFVCDRTGLELTVKGITTFLAKFDEVNEEDEKDGDEVPS